MIKLIKSSFYNEADTKRKLAAFIMLTQKFSMGIECRKYEEAFASKQGRKHAVMVNSGSSANLILIQALLNVGKIKKGDKVGVSALTWATNIMPILQLGLVPVPIDCEINTLNVSPETLKSCIRHIKLLFLTNVLGLSDDIASIRKICKKNNVILLEDNCESLGSEAAGTKLGNFGLASTFSFFVGHHLSTIEGGMVTTDSEELYHMLIMVRAHGWDRNLQKTQRDSLRKKHNIDNHFALYTFYELAYNVRPTEINGFLGNIQLKYWNRIVEKREKNFIAFNANAKNNPELIGLRTDRMDTVSNFAMPVIAKTHEAFKKYKKLFEDAGVEIRPIIAGDMTKQPFFRKHVVESYSCPNAAYIHDNAFYFGNNPELTKEEIKILTNLLQ